MNEYSYALCPFCGTNLNDHLEVMIIEKKEMRITPDNYRVHCIKCGAYGPAGWSKSEAVRCWNKRVKGAALSENS